ncbi:MAG TPA: shikimate kinase [Acidimicrobiales bacterium]|nr:shikimate kinase [Acidimicrobiales bacterium]
MPDESTDVRATHVVLVGLMGSGKTTVGKKVAKLIGHRFIDADVEIEARTGRSVASWFEDGEPAFRAAEADLLESLLSEPEALVLGAGGGVVVTESNRRRLQEHDVTAVYLHGTPEFLASRVQAKAHRPLLGDDPLDVMQQMYEARDGWYREVADAVVEVRPHHEAGEKPKWRIAEQVVEELIALHVVDPAAVTSPEVLR